MVEGNKRTAYVLACFWQCPCVPLPRVVQEVMQRAGSIRQQLDLQDQKEGMQTHIAYRAFRGERLEEVRGHINAFQNDGMLVVQLFVYHLYLEERHAIKMLFQTVSIPVVFLSFRHTGCRRVSLKDRRFLWLLGCSLGTCRRRRKKILNK